METYIAVCIIFLFEQDSTAWLKCYKLEDSWEDSLELLFYNEVKVISSKDKVKMTIGLLKDN